MATVRDAIIRMGNMEVSNIVSMVALQHNFKSKNQNIHKIMGKLWRHSVGCAIGGNWLARQTGFQAGDGQEGLRKLRAETPDLILLDLRMPEMDGLELARRIRSDPTIPPLQLVMLSSAATRTAVAEVNDAGIDRYREYYSFPGTELNEIGGKNFAKATLEWTLPSPPPKIVSSVPSVL